MALKDWEKSMPDWYFIKRKPSVQIWIETFTSPYDYKKYYEVMHQYAGSGGCAEPISSHTNKQNAHKALMKHIREHNF